MNLKTAIAILSVVLVFTLTFKTAGQDIRPIRDSVGFSWWPAEMNILMNFLKKHNENIKILNSENLVAAISPHDDYLYAGKIYYPLYRLIKTKEVVIFGVTHGTVRKALNDPKDILILDDFKQWRGPYSNVEISPLREMIKSKLNKKDFMVNDSAQTIEHSIEALIPFLQYYNRNIKITPIMVTAMPFEKMEDISGRLAAIISDYIEGNNLKPGKDIFFLISSDANHYGIDFDNMHYGLDENAHLKATGNDVRVARKYLSGIMTNDNIKDFTGELWGNTKNYAPLWCGKYSIPFGLLTIKKVIEATTAKNLSGEIFKYSDSWTEGVIHIKHTKLGLTAPFSLKHWVGYLSEGFYMK